MEAVTPWSRAAEVGTAALTGLSRSAGAGLPSDVDPVLVADVLGLRTGSRPNLCTDGCKPPGALEASFTCVCEPVTAFACTTGCMTTSPLTGSRPEMVSRLRSPPAPAPSPL